MAVDLQNRSFRGSQVFPAQSSTPMERAMADVAGDNILPIEVPIDKLWDPQQCPEQFLPFLAWALSVDIWDADWPVEVKRRVIAASPAVHRRKGTRYAVRTALEAIGISAEIVEWYQASPPARRGTFSVIAYVNEQIYAGLPVINAKMQQLADAAIRASKPKSRVYDFKVGVKYSNRLGVAAMMSPPLNIERRRLRAGPETDIKNRLGVSGVMSAMNVMRKTLSAGAQTKTENQLGIAGLVSGLQIIRINMEGIAP